MTTDRLVAAALVLVVVLLGMAIGFAGYVVVKARLGLRDLI